MALPLQALPSLAKILELLQQPFVLTTQPRSLPQATFLIVSGSSSLLDASCASSELKSAVALLHILR